MHTSPQNPVFPFGYISRSRVAGSSYILFLRAPAIHFNIPFLCLISAKGREKKMYQYHHVGGHTESKYYLRSLSLGNNLSRLPNVSIDQFVYFQAEDTQRTGKCLFCFTDHVAKLRQGRCKYYRKMYVSQAVSLSQVMSIWADSSSFLVLFALGQELPLSLTFPRCVCVTLMFIISLKIFRTDSFKLPYCLISTALLVAPSLARPQGSIRRLPLISRVLFSFLSYRVIHLPSVNLPSILFGQVS